MASAIQVTHLDWRERGGGVKIKGGKGGEGRKVSSEEEWGKGRGGGREVRVKREGVTLAHEYY